jgi:hypothetical protein
MSSHKGRYKERGVLVTEGFIKEVGLAGNAATTRAVRAVSAAVKHSIFIFKYSEETRDWTLFVTGALQAPAIWLTLRKEHYRWLKPKSGKDTAKDIEHLRHLAVPVPTGDAAMAGAGGMSERGSIRSSRSSSMNLSKARARFTCRNIEDTDTTEEEEESEDETVPRVQVTEARSASATSMHKCKCGWAPTIGNGGIRLDPSSTTKNGMRVQHSVIRRHWFGCQGHAPAKISKEVRGKAFPKYAVSAWAATRRKTIASLGKFRAGIRRADIRAATCDLDPEDIETQVSARGRNLQAFRCRQCGEYRLPGSVKQQPCKLRDPKTTPSIWRSASRGKKCEARVQATRRRYNNTKARIKSKAKYMREYARTVGRTPAVLARKFLNLRKLEKKRGKSIWKQRTSKGGVFGTPAKYRAMLKATRLRMSKPKVKKARIARREKIREEKQKEERLTLTRAASPKSLKGATSQE